MIPSNPLSGNIIHAIGDVTDSTCFVPFPKVRQWSWNSNWILQATIAWFIFPLVIGFLTVPNLLDVFRSSHTDVIINAILLGAIYDFGRMCFGFAIRHIGYSLTYTISIGIIICGVAEYRKENDLLIIGHPRASFAGKTKVILPLEEHIILAKKRTFTEL